MTKITITPEALVLIQLKKDETYKLVWGTLYVFFQANKRFPEESDVSFFGRDIDNTSIFLNTNVQDHQPIIQKCLTRNHRTIRLFKHEIRTLFSFSLGTSTDQHAFIDHCKNSIFPKALTWDQTLAESYDYFVQVKLEPYGYKQLNRLLATAHQQFESEFFTAIERSLKPETKKAFDALLTDENLGNTTSTSSLTFRRLKEDQAQLKIDSILDEVQKYKSLTEISIPHSIESIGSRKLFERYYNRVQAERPSNLREHKSTIRYSYLAIFCLIKKQMMTDTLTDLLLKLLKRILTKAESSVDKALALDNKRVKGKMGTLLALAKKSIDYPDGIIKNTIYPDITQERLNEIINELGEDGQWYRNQVKAKALSLYSHNNRRIVWALMNVLNFEANPELSGLLKAINFLKNLNADTHEKGTLIKERLYAPILLERIVPPNWLPFVNIKAVHLT